MPKTGLSSEEWRKRLREYARGNFSFGRGQKPSRSSVWAKVVCSIESCPLHRNLGLGGKDPFGRELHCTCGYHQSERTATPPLSQPSVPSVNPSQHSPLLASSTLDKLTTTQTSSPSGSVNLSSLPDQSQPSHKTNLSVMQQPPLAPPQAKKTCVGPLDIPSLSRQPTDFSFRLPQGWKQTIDSEGDRQWIGRALFVHKGELKTSLKLWWHPPTSELPNSQPEPESYHLRRLLLWMPRLMWKVDFRCTECMAQSLRSKGLYNRVRKVIDAKDKYYLAAEYMDCRRCKGTYIAWDHRMLEQLSAGIRAYFPAVLTRKYACDQSVITMLRSRTLGNSPTALCNNVMEVHSEEWTRRVINYLSDCNRHRKGMTQMGCSVPVYKEPSPFPPFPKAKWFLAVYVRDVWSRLPTLLAAATSIYGSILKIDSTKKICSKLQGAAANTASWVTNVGNERGEVVISVLTESEGSDALSRLATGLMDRYEKACQQLPQLLYTDRDCCSTSGPSKYQALFSKWEGLTVRLDVWHFMRRLSRACSSESHPLYGVFMSSLSHCIFEWDAEDYRLLTSAKRAELTAAGVPDPSYSAVKNTVSKEELARHCKRCTRGTAKTVELIEALFLSLSTATDSLGVPLLRELFQDIWQEQKHHVACLQDPPGVQLYTTTGHLTKGGVVLPVFRCARGSTSLESFHLHLARFIPGTSASAVNYQAYLLDGITRWNAARAAASIEVPCASVRIHDLRLIHKANTLSESILGSKVFPNYQPPSEYTRELYGVEYLYVQSGLTFTPKDDSDLESQIDEGFDEFDEPMSEQQTHSEDLTTITTPPSESETDAEDEAEEEEQSDSRGIPGWDKVERLARVLLDMSGLGLTSSQANEIQVLYTNLSDFDKRPLHFKPVPMKRSTGRFGKCKQRTGHISIDNMKRCFLSAGSPSSSPTKSRLVEAICILLCAKHPHPVRSVESGRVLYTSRWKLVLNQYHQIRARLLNSQAMLGETNLVLYNINQASLIKWFKNKTRLEEISTLMSIQGLLSLCPSHQCSSTALPPANPKPTSLPEPAVTPHICPEPEDLTGQATVRRKVTLPTGSLIDVQSSSTMQHQPPNPTLPPPTAHQVEDHGTTKVSRTTLWRRKKAGGTACKAPRKVYTCSTCGQPVSTTGHTQYRGQRYCPQNAQGETKVDWLNRKKEEATAKSQAKAS